MGISIDIDTGGTFTDAFVSDGSVAQLIKVETTPHDLTQCFLQVFERAAERFAMSERELLARTDVVRYSTTVGTNMLIERRGPRLGLIVAEGAEHSLYAERNGAAPRVASSGFISPDMVRSVHLEAGALASDALEVRRIIAELLDGGARGLVVALPGADRDPGAERALREIVRIAYPRYLLGAIPMLLASEVSAVSDDHRRLATALLNAYLHPTMVRYLYRAEELLRERGYRRPLLIVHSSGGATRVAKTMAIETHNSGPVAGLHGARAKADRYGERSVLTMDIGGTSTDIGLVLDGRVSSPAGAVVDGIPLSTQACELRAIGGGGGSIARVSDGGLSVGPQSAGALPGPASYGLGGSEATVTDANLVLGLLSAEGFFGGGRPLDAEAAERAITEHVAQPLGVDPREAARRVRATLERGIAGAVAGYAAEKGRSPADCVMISFGGGGALHAAAVAERIGVRRVYCFREAPVFSAFGVATMDVVHRYEASVPAGADQDTIQRAVDALQAEAARDMHGEGFDPQVVSSEVSTLEGEGRALIELRATAAIERDLERLEVTDASPVAGGTRTVHLGAEPVAVPRYGWQDAPAGQPVQGPALIDAPFTTAWVPGGWSFTGDQSDAIVLERRVQ
ncbi:MAG TPA: hydantoinase/oxoprolinase family protein [Solirubrobacteraceae bacterium]|jgi:N-methylhydantoinase A/acetophenone carboxylase|nr:hydantoinase/oxoprolinase family protein [Solirubrobacteraceae bacterium]